MYIRQDCLERISSAARSLPDQEKTTQNVAEFLLTPSGIRKRDTSVFFPGATAQIRALAYLHETLRFTSVY
jgi:hypothetical protein